MSSPPGGYQGGGYPPQGGYPPPPPQGGYEGGGYPPPPPGPGGKTQVLGLDYKIAGMLCYLPPCLCCIDVIFSILWIATEPKENRFVRFHALKALFIFGAHSVL